MAEPTPALRVCGLTKLFGEFVALDDVSTTVGQQEVRAIIGPNGAGKTTFVNVVSGLLRASRGQVFLGETDITSMAPHQIARLGMVRTFQITELFSEMTVADHVLVAAMAARRAGESGETARKIDLAVASALDLTGLDALADTPAEKLSHGDCKLLELAMALACKPKLLLLDEPTAGMGLAETTRIVGVINGRLRGTFTIVVIEHDMDVVMQTADRITVLAAGQVLVEGTPQAIQQDPVVQEVYFGSPRSS